MKKTGKSILALLLAVLLGVSLLPAAVFAEGMDEAPASITSLDSLKETEISVPFGTAQDGIPFPALTADGVELKGVTWECENYDGAVPDEYAFTPVIPAETYAVAEDVKRPAVTVTVLAEERAQTAGTAETRLQGGSAVLAETKVGKVTMFPTAVVFEGTSTVTVTGKDLPAGAMRARVFDSAGAAPIGSAVNLQVSADGASATGTLAFPQNTGAAPVAYMIKISTDDGANWDDVNTATVSVYPQGTTASAAVNLSGHTSFQEAVEATMGAAGPYPAISTLIISVKTDGGVWTSDDRNSFQTNFPNVAELDLGDFTGTFGKWAFQKSNIEKVRLPEDVTISASMFIDCANLKTLVCDSVAPFPEKGTFDLSGAASFGNFAFYGSGVEKVRLPANASILDGMFQSCANLKTLVCGNGAFSENVIDLSGYTNDLFGWGAFYGSGAKEVRLSAYVPPSEFMFYGCAELKTLVFIGGRVAPIIGEHAFGGVSDSGTLYYPRGAADYTKGTFGAPDLSNWDFIKASGPEVVSQPSAQTETEGEVAIFQFDVNGSPLVYQWQQSVDGTSWTNLSDGAGYAGVATNMLFIDNLKQGQNGYQFRCAVSNPFGYGTVITSRAATLTVNAALQPPAAPYDKAAPGDLVFTYATPIAGPDVGELARFTYLPTGEMSPEVTRESQPGAGDGFVYTQDVGVAFPLTLMQRHASPNGSGVAGLRTGRYRLDLTVMLADGVSKVYSAEFEIIDSTPAPESEPDPAIPQTGDTANPLPWLPIMLAALLGCASLLLYRRRSA